MSLSHATGGKGKLVIAYNSLDELEEFSRIFASGRYSPRVFAARAGRASAKWRVDCCNRKY